MARSSNMSMRSAEPLVVNCTCVYLLMRPTADIAGQYMDLSVILKNWQFEEESILEMEMFYCLS